MIRVGMVCGDYDPARDGVSAYTERLAQSLSDVDVDVTIMSSRPGGQATVPGWRFRDVPSFRGGLSRLHPDLVHVQFAPSAYAYHPGIGLLPMACRGRPLVVTLHEYGWWSWRPGFLPRPLGAVLVRWAERRGWWDRETLRLTVAAAAIVVTNDSHAEEVRERLGKRRPPVHVVPIGSNVATQPPSGNERHEVRALLGAPADAPLLVFFGFVHPVKGIRYLLEATASLATRHPALRLAIVGGVESLALRGEEAGDYRREVEEMISALGLEGRVTLTGYVEEQRVSRFLCAADAVVLPYTAGLTAKSGALLAALAHGAPVVGTRSIPPDPDLSSEGLALLVPPRQSAPLAQAIERVISSPELAARLRDAGLAFAKGRSWDHIAATHATIYRDVLARRRSTRR